jgi:hypothetical protein
MPFTLHADTSVPVLELNLPRARNDAFGKSTNVKSSATRDIPTGRRIDVAMWPSCWEAASYPDDLAVRPVSAPVARTEMCPMGARMKHRKKS